MSANLVTYSDEEEDANYDDVGMDMSDDDDGGDNDKGASKDPAAAGPNEYGPGPSKGEASEYGSFEPPRKKQQEHRVPPRPPSVAERLLQMSADQEDAERGEPQQRDQHRRDSRDSRDRVSASSSVSQGREDGRDRERDREHDRDRPHRRRRSRSRSRERRRKSRSRSRERRRRSRSRSRERERNRRRGSPPSSHRGGRTGDRGHRDDQRSRAELRSRKMVAMGIVAEAVPGEGDPAAVVKQLTGVEVPSYYNPNAINPLKYAEGVKKRQMLWGAKGPTPADPMAPSPSTSSSGPLNFTAATSATEKEVAKVSGTANLPAGVIMPKQKVPSNSPFKQSFNKWENTNFGDTNTNDKFRRLMGIKSAAGPAPPPKSTEEAAAATVSDSPSAAVTTEKTQAMFREQEEQYERARAITHTAKGLGLGFSSLGPH